MGPRRTELHFSANPNTHNANWEKTRHRRCHGFEPVAKGEAGSRSDTGEPAVDQFMMTPHHHDRIGQPYGLAAGPLGSVRLPAEAGTGRKRPVAPTHHGQFRVRCISSLLSK